MRHHLARAQCSIAARPYRCGGSACEECRNLSCRQSAGSDEKQDVAWPEGACRNHGAELSKRILFPGTPEPEIVVTVPRLDQGTTRHADDLRIVVPGAPTQHSICAARRPCGIVCSGPRVIIGTRDDLLHGISFRFAGRRRASCLGRRIACELSDFGPVRVDSGGETHDAAGREEGLSMAAGTRREHMDR